MATARIDRSNIVTITTTPEMASALIALIGPTVFDHESDKQASALADEAYDLFLSLDALMVEGSIPPRPRYKYRGHGIGMISFKGDENPFRRGKE